MVSNVGAGSSNLNVNANVIYTYVYHSRSPTCECAPLNEANWEGASYVSVSPQRPEVHMPS